MKSSLFLICSVILLFSGCTTKEVKHFHGKVQIARITAYTAHEDKFGARVAWSGAKRAKEGRTVAADPRIFRYGQVIYIPGLNNRFHNNNVFRVEDTGSAVKAQKASHGCSPVIDIFLAGNNKKIRDFCASTPEFLRVYSF